MFTLLISGYFVNYFARRMLADRDSQYQDKNKIVTVQLKEPVKEPHGVS